MFKKSQTHPFHLVDPSPWPLLSALSALFFTFGTVLYLHGYSKGSLLYKLGFILILSTMFFWWRDVIREATFEGQHTKNVQVGLKLGVVLFIVSEFMFFFGFFFAFFHFSINPSIAIGGVWPPVFLNVLNPWEVPLLNTIILLTSGITITLAHHSIVLGSKFIALSSLSVTIVLAVIFTFLQALEYLNSPFSIYTTVYGSIFFLLTGFHGFHVIVGTSFLIVCLIRIFYNHFTKEHHFGFEAAAWYWHFVDVVWLFLYLILYWWGS